MQHCNMDYRCRTPRQTDFTDFWLFLSSFSSWFFLFSSQFIYY